MDYLPEAEAKIKQFTEQGLDKLPLCMAKTHLSLSHDPALKGRPRGFRARTALRPPKPHQPAWL